MGYFKNLLIKREEESMAQVEDASELQNEPEETGDWEAWKREEQSLEKARGED